MFISINLKDFQIANLLFCGFIIRLFHLSLNNQLYLYCHMTCRLSTVNQISCIVGCHAPYEYEKKGDCFPSLSPSEPYPTNLSNRVDPSYTVKLSSGYT